MADETLSDYELRVLSAVAGERRMPRQSTAVSVAIQQLHGRGYITRSFGDKLTETGRAALVAAKDAGR